MPSLISVMKKFIGCLFGVLLVLISLLFSFSSCISRGIIFPGPAAHDTDALYQSYFQASEAIEIKTPDGICLRGWFVNRGVQAPLVVMYGGNAMNVGAFCDFARADESRSYLLVNYRGYGSSEGKPSQDAIVGDSIMAIDWAGQQLGSSPKLILVGFSIGSGVAMQVAAKTNPDAVILICPFDSVEAVARQMLGGFGAFLVRNNAFRSTEVAPQLNCPVTIFAGSQDTIIPPERTIMLIASFTQTKPLVYWLPAGHNDLMSAPTFAARFERALNY